MNPKVKSFVGWCRRYIRISFIAMVAILVYVLFFSDNSVIDNYEYQTEIDRLRAQIMECNDSIDHYESLNRRLRTDPEVMERIVREQYHMQRPNEDVYVVE